MRVVRFAQTGFSLLACIAATTVLPGPADADTGSCVRVQELAGTSRGASVAQVARRFDVNGRYTAVTDDGSRLRRSHRSCWAPGIDAAVVVVSHRAAKTGNRYSQTSSRACRHVRITAHRGLTRRHVENTVPAFRSAVDAGFDVETDLRVSKNGDILLIHNSSIARVTDGTGLVVNLTTRKIRSYHTADGTVIPYLTDLLRMLRRHPQRHAFLELKAMTTAAMVKLRDRLTEYGLRDRVVVYSFQSALVTEYRSIDPAAGTSVIFAGLPTMARAIAAGGAHVHMNLVRPGWAAAMRRANIPFYARNTEAPADWALAAAWRSPTQTTDAPREFRAWCHGSDTSPASLRW